jgi:thiamine transport system substrate-binding protein
MPAKGAEMQRRMVAILLMIVVLLAACGDDSDTSDTTQGQADVEGDEKGDTEPVKRTVTLITYDSFSVTEALLDDFTAETGITIDILTAGDSGTMVNQLILTKDAPIGDVVWGVDNTLLSRALSEELFEPYASPLLESVPVELQLDGTNRLVPVDRGDVCLNYDRAYFVEAGLAPPSGLADLIDPSYRGLLVVQNPATSSPGLAFMLATIAEFGTTAWEEYWADLRANDVLVTPGWDEAYYGEFTVGGGGDRPIVVSYASSPPAEVIFADPRPATAPTGVVEDTCFGQIEFAGILAGTDEPDASRRVIDFLLGRTLQEDIPLNMFVFPSNSEAELPPEFVEFTVVPADPLTVDPADIDANREAWIERWTEIVVR